MKKKSQIQAQVLIYVLAVIRLNHFPSVQAYQVYQNPDQVSFS